MSDETRCITLLSDFGLRDSYVAQMKGAVLGICADASILDLSHELPHADISAASFFISEAIPCFPSGAIHVAVVDPGVGSDRRAVLLEVELLSGNRMFLVGPDNGIFTEVIRKARSLRAWALSPVLRPAKVGSTFDGRDLFAPTAARLASGISPEELGATIDLEKEPLVELDLPLAEEVGQGQIAGVIRSIDRFGNAISNIEIPEGAVAFELALENRGSYRSVNTYEDIAEGEMRALVNSSGLLELAARCRSAAENFHIKIGDRVVLKLR